MASSRRSLSTGGLAASGAVAGAFSALVFCVAHQLFISPIWFALVAMLVAGAACGACLAWSYAVAVGAKTVRSWFQYNALYVAILSALGLTSLFVFEPVTTIPELLRSNEPPRALIAQALPMTALFTAASAAFLSAVYRPGWRGAMAILVTTLVVVVVLGLNISILGLVSVPREMLYVIGEVLVLIVALAFAYAAPMAYYWRAALRST